MSLNQKALLLFESNRYNEALASFEEAVSKERTVQALNNSPWMYLYEEEDLQRAKVLLEEVLVHDPQSHFPYNMFGEIAMKEQNWLAAKKLFEKSLDIIPSTEAIHNLAVIHYNIGDFPKAVNGFKKIAEDSNLIRWFEVLARIKNEDQITAKFILDSWNEHAEDYTGAIEPADAYVEIDCFEEAKIMFEKEWEEYFVSPYIISRYAYALFQLNEFGKCEKLIQGAIDKKIIEIAEEKQESCDEQWSETDKTDRIAELRLELTGLRQIIAKLNTGYRPPLEVELHSTSSCYLFGCAQHGNAEYVLKEA